MVEAVPGRQGQALGTGGGERKFDRYIEAFVMLGLQHARPPCPPLSHQPARVSLAVMCNHRE